MSRTYLKQQSLLAPAVVATEEAATSAVVDLNEFPDGDLVLAMHAAKAVAESGDSLTAKWMEADAEEGPFEDSGLVFTEVGETADVLDEIVLDRTARLQFGKFVGTPDGDTPAIGLAVSLVSFRHFTT
jgi:hypothetical protein